MNADGTDPRNLTNHPRFDSGPAWSPDGTRIAFNSDRDGNPEIYVMNADGTDPRNLTNDPDFDVLPAWSPDGSRIAFTSDRDEGDDEVCVMCDDEVYVMNADGTDPRNLTNNPAEDTQPVWSPAP